MCKQQDCGWGCVWTVRLCKWKFKEKRKVLMEQWNKIVTNPQFPTFNSTDLSHDTAFFGLQNEQSRHSPSNSNDCEYNPNLQTFNSPDFSFDVHSTFGFEQFSHPSSNLTEFAPNVPNENLSFSVPPMVAPALVSASQPSQFGGADGASVRGPPVGSHLYGLSYSIFTSSSTSILKPFILNPHISHLPSCSLVSRTAWNLWQPALLSF